ncbi:ribose-5-phosphate isomerase RpiA [Tengunoibacter tsumagoiensis]|uniref:Ribose-5-phosphate isomerase A n=1 Tax=Tengunoibacter tsumagoiensis TaxID=2014871 RepID=A0A402A2L8_9CHLR|nr:ribose-5-phosphate isomerase RpiA [Tengunoibacter tsumagoiensis]GCE13397.1 ribose-5-phosphate isomerase A [Tengunoibacter tsumagoiensis]
MTAHTSEQDNWKKAAGEAAAQLVQDGMLIGLGTGSTANYFIQALGLRLQAGLQIAGAVPSSNASHDLAAQVGIPLTTLDAHPELDLYIDGADEIDPELRLLKGAGGALVREKIVASSAQRFIVIADPSKQVSHLGQNFPVPVEVTPFGVSPVLKHLQALGASAQIRVKNGSTFISDNSNLIVDCRFPQGISDPSSLDARIHQIVGVVETGLFIHMASQVIIGGPNGLQYLP